VTDLTWRIDEPGCWELETAHFATPLTRYFHEVLRAEFPRGFSASSARVGLLLDTFDHARVNGFDYMAPRIVGAPKAAKGPPPKLVFQLLARLHPKIRARLRTAAHVFETRPWREDLRLWREEVRPASTRTHLALQARDPGSLDDGALAQLLEDLHANAHEQYFLHHRFTVPAMLPVGDFLAQVRGWTGKPFGELLQAVRQPRGVHTDATAQLDAAARAVGDDAAARALVEGSGTASEVLDALAAQVEAVRAWLTLTGWRLVTGYDIADLTAYEMPELAVRTLRAVLAGRDDRARANALREEALVRVRDDVPAQHRADFDALLAEAQSVSDLREERALVCDFWAFGLVRRAVLEAGRRVARAGRIHDPLHLIEASHTEMLALLRGEPGPDASVLAQAFRYRTTTTSEIAPRHLGTPPSPPPPPEWYPPATRRMNAATEAVIHAMFHEPEPRSEPAVVRGLNASAGVYEGTARLVLRPSEMTRIQQGEILVTRMTTEAYNGIVPLLGAIVTDRGGLLSHAATVAREYGIPAIVGTQEATRLVRDGARLVVDGSRGEARVVG
jgi:rifampicin phosphotransferase